MSMLHRRKNVIQSKSANVAVNIPPWDVLRMMEFDELLQLGEHYDLVAEKNRSALLSKLNTLRKLNEK